MNNILSTDPKTVFQYLEAAAGIYQAEVEHSRALAARIEQLEAVNGDLLAACHEVIRIFDDTATNKQSHLIFNGVFKRMRTAIAQAEVTG